jgi:hypothetical protein
LMLMWFLLLERLTIAALNTEASHVNLILKEKNIKIFE